MNPLEFINQIKDMYNDQDPSSMAQGPRNMYQDGLLVGTPTDQVTQFDRRIYETPEGERVSERSATLFLNGKWINVPSIHGGREFNEDQLRSMLKEGAIEPTSIHKSRSEAETAAMQRSDMMKHRTKGFADGQLVTPNVDGSRPGYSGRAEKLFTSNQQQKIKDAFPNIKFDFTEDQKFGVQKYLESKKPGPDTRKVNKDYTKVARFIKKGFKKEMGEGKTTRGTIYQGERLSIADQNKIKAKFDLPEGVKEWDFKTHKYGIKQAGRENLVVRMARTVADKNPWTLAADFGSTKGWMLAQMERVYKNEIKNNPTGKLTYEPIYEKINGVKRIIGFKDNTKAGGGKTYYGLNKYTKKKAGNWTKHGDWKLNQKLVDISKRSGNAPNEVITGLLKKRGFAGKVKLNDLVHFLSGTEGTSKERIKNAIVRHHESGVKFGSATNDLALTTQTINKRIVEAEKRIRANNILPDDIQLLKNNNVYVRHQGKLYGSGSKTPIGQFKQIESSVAKALETGKTFAGKDFTTKQLTKYLTQLCPKKASGGRIGYQGGGVATVDCGVSEFNKLLKQGKGNNPLVKKILQGGGNILKAGAQQLNPAELLKLRNLVGPQALGFFAAYEAGAITDDVLRKNTPLNEALSKNWLTKSFMPYSEEFAKQKNLLQSGKLDTDSKRIYALDMMKAEKAWKEMDRIEGMEAGQILDQSGYGMIDGSPITSQEDIDAAKANVSRIIGDLDSGDSFTNTGKQMENIAAMDEMIASRPEKFKYFLQGDRGTPLTNKLARPSGRRMGPMTAKREMKVDFSLPTYDRTNITEQDVRNMYKDESWISPTEYKSGYKLSPGELTWWRMQNPGRGTYGTQEKFMGGGRAGYMGGGIAAIRKPNALPPTGGPQSGGLPSLYNNDRKL